MKSLDEVVGYGLILYGIVYVADMMMRMLYWKVKINIGVGC